MSFVLFVLMFGFALVLFPMRVELRKLRDRVDELEGRPFGPAPAEDVPVASAEPEYRVAAKVTGRRDADDAPAFAGAQEPEPEPRPSRFADLSFEGLVGGKLPIWIGGIALVFAGFFLVRYTIEAGLFGPGARSITATAFALAMIAMSELGGRIPKIGASFTADPRVAQSLAGAGVATLYGTLYMAAEIYALIGVPTAFVLVLIVTAIAFALSLRHGPPTALMGLTGGFAAPWVAGMGASNLPVLLLYLAVFIAALFGLAVWRRWLWLLVLASGGGLLWSFAMLATAESNLGLLGGFIAATGAGALLAARRFEGEQKGWSDAARYLPMALAFVQLAILLPEMEFSATGWLFYFALSALAIALAWRDRLLLPLVAGALLLSAVPLLGAWSAQAATALTISITLGIAGLFGISGHLGARRTGDEARYWAFIGLAAPALCWFVAAMTDTGYLSPNIWGTTAALAALTAAFMAWDRYRNARNAGIVQGAATATTALMAAMACIAWFPSDWAASYTAIIALSVAAWAQKTGVGAVRRIAIVPLAIAMLAGSILSYQLLEALGASLSGNRALYDLLPTIGDANRTALIPALLILTITWQPVFATGRKTRALAFAAGGAGVAAFIWLLAKQPAAITTPADFIRLGFAERAIFTQILFGLAWLALAQAKARSWPSLANAGWVLAGVALFRVVWFDLLLLNPVMVPQAVGPVPVANLVTVHMVLTAFWLWTMANQSNPLHFAEMGRGTISRSAAKVDGGGAIDDSAKAPPSAASRLPPPHFDKWGGLKILSLSAMIFAVLVAIRQAVQGNLISGGSIGTGENYLYSAGLLALAIGWLVIGMTRGQKLLRVAGLSLLTLVTLKVFLVDAAALTGLLRILSFLGLGIALIGIGWAYGRVMGTAASKATAAP